MAGRDVYKRQVAGTGYVGLSISVLLAQHNHVVAVDIIPEKIALINQKKSPIQDEYIEKMCIRDRVIGLSAKFQPLCLHVSG